MALAAPAIGGLELAGAAGLSASRHLRRTTPSPHRPRTRYAAYLR